MRSRSAAAVAAEREPAAGQQLEKLGPPDARDEGKLVAPRGRGEGLDGAPWIAGLEQGGGERHPGRAGEALIEPPRQLDALFGGGERDLDVAGRERREGAIAEIAGERLDVARQSCSLDGVVEQLGGFGQVAAQQLDLAEDRVWKRDEFALAGRPSDSYRAFGVGFGLLVAVEVELGAGQVGGGIEPKGEFVIVQSRDEGGRLRATCFGLRGGTARRGCERQHGDRGGGQRPVAERPCGAERPLGPVAHLLVVHAGEAVHRELDHERRRLPRGGVAQAVHRVREAGVGLLVAAEQVLHAGTGRREPHPQRD
jgi:hypothetical protein